MYKITLTLLGLTVLFSLNAQQHREAGIRKNLFLDVGGSYSSFQDTKYSDVREGGMGAFLELGFSHFKRGKHFWEPGFSFNIASEHAATHDQATSLVMYINPYFKYLKGLNDKIYVGGRVDLLNNYIRVYTNLTNNSTFATFGNSLYGSFLYRTRLSEKWQFQAMADLALIGVQSESPGFAMNYKQKRIEKGEVDYQDPGMGDPNTYAYARFTHPGNNFILKTQYSFLFRKRISLSYNWQMQRFSVISGYPTTWGLHNLVFRVNILHREK